MAAINCPDGTCDALQLWWFLEQHAGLLEGEKMCVLLTGPTQIHLIGSSRCHMCCQEKKHLMQELLEYFTVLDPTIKPKHIDFFKKYHESFRDKANQCLTAPAIGKNGLVSYLGLAHLPATAVGDLLDICGGQFYIDCKRSRLVIGSNRAKPKDINGGPQDC